MSKVNDTHAAFIVRLARLLISIALRPRATAKAITDDPAALNYGLCAWLLMGAMYTITVCLGWLNGFGAVVEPWLPIPPEDYYFWEMFFVIPVYFLVFITAAGTMQLVARGLGGGGSFEHTFTIVAMGGILPTFIFMWLPETLLMALFPSLRAEALGGFSFLPGWADAVRQLIVPVWTIAVYSLALSTAKAVPAWKAVVAVMIGMIPASVVAFAFIR